MPTGLLGKILWSILYGVCVLVALLIIAAILNAVGFPQIGSIINRFAAVLALLAALVTFFSRA